MTNDLNFLTTIHACLELAGIPTWIMGGWAEELWGISAPRQHHDVDLLYPAADFNAVDRFLAGGAGVEEITSKRFAHKRAFLSEGVMVELILAQKDGAGWVTDFFAGGCIFKWPKDTFRYTVRQAGRALPLASPTALRDYRDRHAAVEVAYQAFLDEQPLVSTGND